MRHCARPVPDPAPTTPPPEVVVLIHGWWSAPAMLTAIACRLRRRGYRVVSLRYPSVRVPYEDLVERELPRRLAQCLPAYAPRIHFVAHSLGAILLREYLRRYRPASLGRVVMLAPPHQGSQLADRWLRLPGALQLAGPNLARLGTRGPVAQTARMPAAYELGIVAGTGGWWNPVSPLPRPHDGRVSLESTRLPGAKAHLCVPASHSLLPWHPQVLDQIEHFLQHGDFRRPSNASSTTSPA